MSDRQNPKGYFTDKDLRAASSGRYNNAPGAKAGGGREDRRQAYLADERERKIKEAVMRRRADEERLRREAAEARRAAEREAKRRLDLERELAAKRRERENLRRYEEERRKLEARRRREEEERERAAEIRLEKLRRRRHRINAVKFHIKVFAAAVLVTLAIVTFFAYRVFYRDNADPTRKVAYYFEGEKVYSAGASVAYCNGKICIDFTDIAKRYGFYTAGDSKSLKYVIPKDGGGYDSIEFYLDSNTASVNGTPVALETESRYVGGSLWVSCSVGDFFEGGLEIKAKNAGRVETVRVKTLDNDGKPKHDADGNYVYDEIELSYKSMIQNEKIDLVTLYGKDAKGLGRGGAVTFSSDLSAYEDYMNPSDSNEFLVLVNRDNKLDVSYIPGDLTNVGNTRADGRAAQRLRKNAAIALEAMFTEMKAAGYTDVSVLTGFVSYNEQANEFATNVNKEMAANGMTESEAKTAVSKYCDEAGTCDLQTGLTVIMHNQLGDSAAFRNEAAYSWLKENAWKFGFIERYPADKQEITAHFADPTEFRFVGRFAAENMKKNDWCLEEYLLNDIKR